jgi:hypothetical protein
MLRLVALQRLQRLHRNVITVSWKNPLSTLLYIDAAPSARTLYYTSNIIDAVVSLQHELLLLMLGITGVPRCPKNVHINALTAFFADELHGKIMQLAMPTEHSHGKLREVYCSS